MGKTMCNETNPTHKKTTNYLLNLFPYVIPRLYRLLILKIRGDLPCSATTKYENQQR